MSQVLHWIAIGNWNGFVYFRRFIRPSGINVRNIHRDPIAADWEALRVAMWSVRVTYVCSSCPIMVPTYFSPAGRRYMSCSEKVDRY
jgi:hypothetical protein